MFNFLKRTLPSNNAPLDTGADDEPKSPGATKGSSALAWVLGDRAVLLHGTTSADLKPIAGQVGADAAKAAIYGLKNAPPRSVTFIATPDTTGQRDAVEALLRDVANQGKAAEGKDELTTLLVQDFTSDGLNVLRLEPHTARTLVDGVAQAVEMLAATVPAAFDSDSYRVSARALEEELRSGHDTAIDDLKRRALAANVGLLHSPHGYALAPIHDGRVVAPEVVNALPETLRADVDAKLATFEAELSKVLSDRAILQQSYAQSRRDLDRDTAGLAVRAALGDLTAKCAKEPEASAFLERLRADLVRNAALFLSQGPSLEAASLTALRPRAPIEIAQDPRLARYRVVSITGHPNPSSTGRLVRALALDRGSLMGEVRSPRAGTPLSPSCVAPGVLPLAGSGIVWIEATELLADAAAWPLLRQAMIVGSATPCISRRSTTRLATFALPISCRVVITGTQAQYADLCRQQDDAGRIVRLVTAFEAAIARSPQSERLLAQHAAALIAQMKLTPLDGPELATLIASRALLHDDRPMLSTDLDGLRTELQKMASAQTAAKREASKTNEHDVQTEKSPPGADRAIGESAASTTNVAVAA